MLGYIVSLCLFCVCKLEVIEEPNMKGKPSTSKAEAITSKHCLGVWGEMMVIMMMTVMMMVMMFLLWYHLSFIEF